MPKVSTKIKYADRQRASEETKQHGDYDRHNGIDQNHRASPLVRWKSSGDLVDQHLVAIAWCQKRWALIGQERSITASYGERVSRSTGEGESGAAILSRMDARDDLHRVCGGIGLSGEYEPGYIPRPYWRIFENCIRFNEPAGVIGSHLGKSAPSARALTVVQFVSDLIAWKERLTY